MSRPSFSVVGAHGFIGRHVARKLESDGYVVRRVDRVDEAVLETALGHVIFAAGVTADFRTRPFDTAEANVAALGRLLSGGRWEGVLYLSSTRVYDGTKSAREDSSLCLNPQNPSHLYNATKLAGEALCLALPQQAVRVVRLSNVYGADDQSGNLLTALLRDATERGHLYLRSAPDSAKDFVSVGDVAGVLPRICEGGRHRLYNVAAGRNLSYSAVVEALARVSGCTYEFEPDAPETHFPPIEIERLRTEFGFNPARLEDEMESLWRAYRDRQA